MSRYPVTFALFGFVLTNLVPVFAQKPDAGPKSERTEGIQRYGGSNLGDVEWSVVRTKKGNTESITRVFQGVSDTRPFLVEEEKITKVNERTTKVAKSSFSLDANGKRRPVEVMDEEHNSSANGAEQVTRTVSSPDMEGRLNVVRRESETRTMSAPGQWSTSTAIMLPSINGGFKQAQAVEQVERETAPGVRVVSTVASTLDVSQKWTTTEQRDLVVEERKDASKSEREEIYRPDVSGRLTLAERGVRSYRKDSGGREYWTEETYGGKTTGVIPNAVLQLERKTTTVREASSDGGMRTVQRVETRNSVDASVGMQVVEETVSTSKPVGGGATEVVVEVRAPDGNGSMKVIETRKMKVVAQ